ncbi:MAG: suppressor of fused domain protein [Muribaculaceae bacterium]
MKRYTLKNLPQSTQAYVDDMALSLAKSRTQYLWCAFKDFVHNDTLRMRICMAISLVFMVLMAIAGSMEKSGIFLAILLVYYGRYLWSVNTIYSLYKENSIFPVLTSEGPCNVMKLHDNQRYIRVERPSWEEVERISFYDDYLVIVMKKNSKAGIFFMWADDMHNVQTSVLNMWRNAMNAKQNGIARHERYSDTERHEVSEFIKAKFGESRYVLSLKQSHYGPMDILVIPPDNDHNFYTLCTLGAGAHRMDVPDEQRCQDEIAEHLEMLSYLPADWDFSPEGMHDTRNLWPVKLLYDCAILPIAIDSWMAWGHSFSYESDSESEETFAPGVPFSSAILLSPQPDIYEDVTCPLSSGKSIDFYQIFPITHSELVFKLQHSEEDGDESSTTRLLEEYINADLDNWMDFALSRFNYRKYQ